MDYLAPCDGCRFAKWYDHAPDYGTCEHPTVVMLKSAPMVVRSDMRIEGIARRHMFDTDCRTREVKP